VLPTEKRSQRSQDFSRSHLTTIQPNNERECYSFSI